MGNANRWNRPNAENSSLPGKAEFGGYIYVIEFDNDSIKVGRSSNPHSRIGQHRESGHRFGVKIVQTWVSSLHDNHVDNERELIRHAGATAQGVAGSEYFTGISFEHAVKFAQSLTFRPVDVEERRRRREESLAAWKAWYRRMQELNLADERQGISEQQKLVRTLFAGSPDGTYQMPSPLRAEDEDPDQVARLQAELARSTGKTLGEVQDMSWMDLRKHWVIAMVESEALAFQIFAIEQGRHDLLTPWGQQA